MCGRGRQRGDAGGRERGVGRDRVLWRHYYIVQTRERVGPLRKQVWPQRRVGGGGRDVRQVHP